MGRPKDGIDFMVGGYQISGTSSANLILSAKKDGSWSKIVISYIVTSRNDFFLGSFTISSHQFQPLGNNQFTYGHSLVYWSSFGSHSVYQQAHLSGIKTLSNQLTAFRIDNTRIDQSSGQIVVIFTIATSHNI